MGKCFFKNKVNFTCFNVLFVGLFFFFSWPKDQVFAIYCLRVIDGDTVVVRMPSGAIEKVRFRYIDAPELKQKSFSGHAIGKEATEILRKKIQAKKITLKRLARDRYGRLLAEIWHENQDICLWMVQKGYALIYPFSVFSRPSQKAQYLKAFNRSWLTGQGMFAHGAFESPYQWRKRHPWGK